MSCELNKTELALTKVVFEVVVVEEVGVTNYLAKAEKPILLLILALEVKDP